MQLGLFFLDMTFHDQFPFGTFLENNPKLQSDDIGKVIQSLSQPCSALMSSCRLRHLVIFHYELYFLHSEKKSNFKEKKLPWD